MLRDVRLRLLPNVLDCLRWSPDGQLAVSASEDVIILVRSFNLIFLAPKMWPKSKYFAESMPNKILPTCIRDIANQKLRVLQVPKNGNTSGKRSHQFHHARANLRELMVNSMNDEIPPADGIVPLTGLDHFLSVGEIE
jgi:hypothetical protein